MNCSSQKKKTHRKSSRPDKRKSPRILSLHWGSVLGDFLVYVAAVLCHEPIFAQPLGFIFGTAGAVEQLAMQRAVGVADSRHTVLILKLRIAFLTGHQIKPLHSASSFPFSCVRHTTLSFYHEHQGCAIDACTKKQPEFSERVCIDTFKSVRKERAACTGTVQIRKGLGFPNKHFATQNLHLCAQRPCLQQQFFTPLCFNLRLLLFRSFPFPHSSNDTSFRL